jgi:hypothetical protein
VTLCKDKKDLDRRVTVDLNIKITKQKKKETHSALDKKGAIAFNKRPSLIDISHFAQSYQRDS